jgi:hypothetical protein
MVITEERIDVVRFNSGSDTPRVPGMEESRSRDANGHCWDGGCCDHPDHGIHGTIHLIR